MPRRGPTLRRRLLVIWLASIAGSLLLAGLLFALQARELHRDTARTAIHRAFELAAQQLQSRRERLLEDAALLARRDETVAAVSLVDAYQNPFAYEPLVFDAEKARLARALRQQAEVAGLELIAAYDSAGELLAFSHRSETGPRQAALVTFENDRPQLRAVDGGIVDILAPLADGPLTTDGPRFDLCPVPEGLLIDAVVPLERHLPDGSQRTVGMLRVGDLIGQDFVNDIAARTGINLVLALPNGPDFGSLRVERTVLEALETLPLKQALEGERWWHPEVDELFLGTVSIEVAGGGRALLAAGEAKTSLMANISTMLEASLVMLGLAGVVLLPAGAFLLDRTFSRPLQRLVASVEATRHGRYANVTGFHGGDELGTLADAFNAMTDRLARREQALRRREAEMRLLLSSSGSGIIALDTEARCRLVNPAAATLLGFTDPDDLIGKGLLPFIVGDERHRVDWQHPGERAVRIEQVALQRDDGSRFPAELRSFPMWRDREWAGTVVLFDDISERLRTQEQLNKLSRAVEQSPVTVIITDLEGRIEYVNPRFEELTGYGEEEVLGKTPRLLKSGYHPEAMYRELWTTVLSGHEWRGELYNRKKNGELFWESASISPIRSPDSGRITHLLAVKEDITDRKHAEEQLVRQASYDALTDLPNRLLATDRLEHALAQARRHGRNVVLMFIDLDNFKHVNDTLGHAAGDDLLLGVVGRWRAVLREEDTLARFGGDEFLLILSDYNREGFPEAVARKLLDALHTPFHLHEQELVVSASIGLALFPDDGRTAAELLRDADAAMYSAKAAGRNTYRFFTPAMNARSQRRLQVESQLRHALADDELDLHFQPQVCLANDRIVGLEALVRWDNKTLGGVGPDEFIPVAEESGLILGIGEWVLRRAVTLQAEWRRITPVAIAINVSPRQLETPGFADKTLAMIERLGADPSGIEVELTESMLVANPEATGRVLEELKTAGLRLALDDFGTGYSSLSYLQRFPFDILKIDRRFVADLPSNAESLALTRSIITMAHDLGMKVVAEGVETAAQRTVLHEAGCDQIQGYLISRPLPHTEIADLLRGRKAN